MKALLEGKEDGVELKIPFGDEWTSSPNRSQNPMFNFDQNRTPRRILKPFWHTQSSDLRGHLGSVPDTSSFQPVKPNFFRNGQ